MLYVKTSPHLRHEVDDETKKPHFSISAIDIRARNLDQIQ